ncbi:hypothetical protein WJX72_001732 [[Myrmecia] bisecta]|uniref:Uncharacterized protein n=1 Tax=[Myrmecia] bisecta TaxID=41462 RepID=A0AAW1PPB3_9CHLO
MQAQKGSHAAKATSSIALQKHVPDGNARQRSDDEILMMLRGTALPTNSLAMRSKPQQATWTQHPAVAVKKQKLDLSGLRFMGSQEGPPQRHVAVPDRLGSAGEYASCWAAALEEELNIRMAELAKRFHAVRLHKSSANGQGSTFKPKEGAAAGPVLEKRMRGARVPLYTDAELTMYQRSKKALAEDAEDGQAKKATSIFLTLKSGREKSSEYHKDDLWVLSSGPTFDTPLATRVRITERQWVAVARSLWHGPNQEGRMEIEFLSGQPSDLKRSQPAFAIHGPDASLELSIVAALQDLHPSSLPVLPALLGSSPAPADPRPPVEEGQGSATDNQELSAAVAEVAQQFGLNPEQAAVVQQTDAWFQPAYEKQEAANPVCIIWGPFGSGKSTLLVALVHFLVKAINEEGSALPHARILVAAHTNVAVDRVLLGLLESGFTDFLRIGPLRRIDKQLLGQSLHCSAAKSRTDAVSELKEMLQASTCAAEAACIQAELTAAQQGAEKRRKKLLKSVALVGCTCCSAGLPVLDGHTFDIVILDECSQMTEPLSMLPLLRAKCRYLVAAGDPCQLPPLIANPAQVTPRPASAPQPAAGRYARPAPPPAGLARPLFVRLTNLGHKAHLLRRQYRCHPDLSSIPNQLFYGGRLLDGCTALQRAPVLPDLAPLCFLDVRGSETYDPLTRSASNRAEALAVVRVLQRLASAGVAAGSIGVICFYRAQVALTQGLLASTANTSNSAHHADQETSADDYAAATIATVDSFQGMEKEVIVLSTTITRASGAFAADVHRLNVALTRARSHLIVVGSAPAVQGTAPAFAQILTRCRKLPGAYRPDGRLPSAALQTSGDGSESHGAGE